MRKKKKKICPIKDCGQEIKLYQHICKDCFKRLPQNLRDRVTDEPWFKCCMDVIRYLGKSTEAKANNDRHYRWWEEK